MPITPIRGQNCTPVHSFSFTLEPVSFDARLSISCDKMADTAARLSANSPKLNGYPASRETLNNGVLSVWRGLLRGILWNVPVRVLAGTRPIFAVFGFSDGLRHQLF